MIKGFVLQISFQLFTLENICRHIHTYNIICFAGEIEFPIDVTQNFIS